MAVCALVIAASIDRLPTSRVTFTDVAGSSGVTFRHAASKTSVKFLPETMGGGVAIFDADGEGWLDLYVGRYLDWGWDTNPVCMSADGSGRAYCHPRLFAPIASVLLHNNGDGTFTDASISSGIAAHAGKALGVAIHDYDRDGAI